MRRLLIAAALAVGAATFAAPAQACAVHQPLNLASIRSADLVVVGRIAGRPVERGNEIIFTVAVDEVLRGRVGRTFPMRFEYRGGAALSRRPGGRFLIALQGPGTTTPPIPFTVMQHICSDPFILDAGSRQAIAARRLLQTPTRR